MKTIKQIADEIGVTKQAIQKRISREPLASRIQPTTTNRGQVTYIDVHGETLIKQAYEGVTIDTVADNPTTKTDNLVYTLQRELDIKNNQIESLMKQNSELTSALMKAQQTVAAAQALHGATVKQNIEDKERKQQGRGIFARIFGKKEE